MADQDEAPKNEEVGDEQPAEEPADEQPQEENNEEEQPQEEPPKEEEPAEEDLKEDEPPKEKEPPKEEPPKEEPPKEEAKEPEPEPEPEKKEEEPKTKVTKKKGKKKKRKKKSSSNSGNTGESDQLWKKISAKKQSDINWYMTKLDGKVGTTTNLTLVQEGTGGAKEIIEFVADKEKNMMFGLLRCITTDDSKSVRAKFIYLRFVGSKVKTMSKARLTPSLGKIDDQFPCKHLTLDINEKCASDMAPEKMAKELLRVGGAHKPDKMEFGPNQEVLMSNLK